MRVLVVEDRKTLADRIAEGLRDAGMAVDVVNDGAAALASAGYTDSCTATRCAGPSPAPRVGPAF
jgi:DNA-binding response OmpR family regulator